MHDLKASARQVCERGYCVLPSVFTPAECQAIKKLLLAVWRARGEPSLAGFGMGIHPLLEHAPDMAPYYARPIILDALEAVLQDEPRLAHTGARVSSEASDAAIGWHEHYAWDKQNVLDRKKPQRVLFGCYVNGSTPEAGPLVVLPRRLNDPIAPAAPALKSDWPGQVVVHAPPGSIVIFDTALYHTAHRGYESGLRILWGAHCQGRNNPMPHPEDNDADNATLRRHVQHDSRLRRFLERTG